MTIQRTPLRSKSSIGTTAGGVSTPQQTLQHRGSITDLRRPPSSRGFRPASPRHTNGPPTTRSRPGSSLGMYSSRPSTPSFSKPMEPYTGSITVSIRPNPYSVDNSDNAPWSIHDYSGVITNKADSTSFQFDNVFPADSNLSNKEVYNKSCSNMVQSFLNDNYNGTVFAYGMTGSGKTFSIKGSDRDPGFVRLAIDDIFNKLESNISEKQYCLSMSYLEIYNEKIIDLLNITNTTELKIRDDPEFGTKVVGISSPDIFSKEQILQLIERGDNNRKTSATEYNARSSRSHSILQIKLKTIDLNNQSELHSVLSLCDLAGSEKATSSAERRKEGSFINKSLLALSTVINKLSNSSYSQSACEHIPYRDSKLTRLLQPALSGASLVLILCTIHLGSIGNNPNQQFITETYNTLRFAARAKDIVMNVQKNQITAVSDEETLLMIKSMQKTIDDQKNELAMLKMKGYNSLQPLSASHGESNDKDNKLIQLESENKILYEKIEHLTRLTDLQKTETIILKNQALNDLLGIGIDTQSQQVMMSNLEDFYKKITYEVNEYKLYTERLESQLQAKFQSEGSLGRSEEKSENSVLSGKQTEAILKDQEEEIYNLKELIKDKDHIIKSLSRTTKIRRLLDSNNTNTHDISSTHISPPKMAYPGSFDQDLEKENHNIDLKEFHISPKKKQAQGPIVKANNARYIM